MVSACSELLELGTGSSIHCASIKFGLFSRDSAGVGSSFVYMYAKCGVLGDAFKVFDEMPVKDVVSWTALIVGYVRNGECEMGLVCFNQMHRLGADGGVRPNSRTVEGALQACGSLGALWEGRCLHVFLTKIGLEYHDSIKSSLLSVYSKCESPEDAFLVFEELPEKDVVSWTAVVGVHARKGLILDCIKLFRSMQDSGVEPDGIFVSAMLTCFVNGKNSHAGKAFHGIALRRNIEVDTMVGNAFISFYNKFELLDIAEKVFNTVVERDSESWNLMVYGCGKMGFDVKCLNYFREMQILGLGLSCDINNLVSVISSCAQLGEQRLGQSAHCYVMKHSVNEHLSVANALIGLYGKCGVLRLASIIFDHTNRDVVTWNSLIGAYANAGYSEDALSLFDQMLLEDVRPNSATLVGILSACSQLAALHRGRWIHSYIKEIGLDSDATVSSALVDMYAKCGQLELSRAVFDSMHERDVVSWNVMISGYGIHGYAKEALEVFAEMERGGVRPNGVTFLAILSACGHAGLVDEGKKLFNRMKEYSIRPTLKHYASMVDLLGRYGHLHEAEEIVLTMPIEPDGAIWGALLGACKMHNNVELGARIASRAFSSDPENDGYYVLMSNMFACVGKWEEVKMLRQMMKDYRVNKGAGWSSIEVGERTHLFTMGDRGHPESDEIYEMLEASNRQIEMSPLCEAQKTTM